MIFEIKEKKDKFLERIYKKAMRELNVFYELNWKYGKPAIILWKRRKDYDKIRRQKTKRYNRAWASGFAIYVLDRKFVEKESNHKYSKESYFALIKHELSHEYFRILSGGRFKPLWLNEGVAVFVSNQNKLKGFSILKFDNFLNYYNHFEKKRYNESGFAVEILIEKFGKKKLLELIKGLSRINSEKEFKKLFKKIYRFELNYRNMNALLK